jgi:hypothetical protein
VGVKLRIDNYTWKLQRFILAKDYANDATWVIFFNPHASGGNSEVSLAYIFGILKLFNQTHNFIFQVNYTCLFKKYRH